MVEYAGRVLRAVRSTRAMALLLLLGIACAPTPSSPAPNGQLGPIKDFKLVAYQGEALLGGSESTFAAVFEHGKPVVLNFWAGACPPCRAEMPWFQTVYDEMQGRFVLVGLDVGVFTALGTQEDARRLLAELDITYPAAYAADATSLREYQVRSMPTTIFLSPRGQVVERHDGLLLEDQLRRTVQQLVAAP